MTAEEKQKLKTDYLELKRVYKNLKKEIINYDVNSQEYYEILGELTFLGLQLKKIRNLLFEEKYGHVYPSSILDRFVFGDESKRGM